MLTFGKTASAKSVHRSSLIGSLIQISPIRAFVSWPALSRVGMNDQAVKMPPKKILKPGQGQKKLTDLFGATATAGPGQYVDTVSDRTDGRIDPDVESEADVVVEKRKFQHRWLKVWPWLFEQSGKMFCKVCIDNKKNPSFTAGCQTFRTSSMVRHEETEDHRWSVKAPEMMEEMETATNKAYSEHDEAVLKLMKVVYWLAQENLPLTKFESLVNLLEQFGVKGLGVLGVNQRVNYVSYYTANELLEAISDVLDGEVTQKLQESPFVTVYADESTDITNKKRMTMTAKVIDPLTSVPSSVYLKDLEYEDGTGEGLAGEIVKELKNRSVPFSKVTGFGSDGASVMTGTGKGVTGRLKGLNPHMVNVHCVAPRLALCTSQAAEGIPILKRFQEWMTSLFYYFKVSPTREQELHKIQSLLDSPQLKYKEIHAVRWMSFFEALETIYRTLDPLITYLHNRDAAKDAKAKGLLKQLATKEFLFIVHLMMDVMPMISKLCLIFQKDDLDVASAKVSLDVCLVELEAYKDGKSGPKTHLSALRERLKVIEDGMDFMGHKISTGNRINLLEVKSQFVNKLISNIRSRFPQKTLLDAFHVLGMRSIHCEQDPGSYGDEEISTLLDFYGEEQVHYARVSDALVNRSKVEAEWQTAKITVRAAKYPVESMKGLWELLTLHH